MRPAIALLLILLPSLVCGNYNFRKAGPVTWTKATDQYVSLGTQEFRAEIHYTNPCNLLYRFQAFVSQNPHLLKLSNCQQQAVPPHQLPQLPKLQAQPLQMQSPQRPPQPQAANSTARAKRQAQAQSKWMAAERAGLDHAVSRCNTSFAELVAAIARFSPTPPREKRQLGAALGVVGGVY